MGASLLSCLLKSDFSSASYCIGFGRRHETQNIRLVPRLAALGFALRPGETSAFSVSLLNRYGLVNGSTTHLREPDSFSRSHLAHNVQSQGYVALDLEIEHPDADVISPVLKGVGKS